MDATAVKIAKEAMKVILGLVNTHKPDFALPKVSKNLTRPSSGVGASAPTPLNVR
jgi:hypothetical protein